MTGHKGELTLRIFAVHATKMNGGNLVQCFECYHRVPSIQHFAWEALGNGHGVPPGAPARVPERAPGHPGAPPGENRGRHPYR